MVSQYTYNIYRGITYIDVYLGKYTVTVLLHLVYLHLSLNSGAYITDNVDIFKLFYCSALKLLYYTVYDIHRQRPFKKLEK